MRDRTTQGRDKARSKVVSRQASVGMELPTCINKIGSLIPTGLTQYRNRETGRLDCFWSRVLSARDLGQVNLHPLSSLSWKPDVATSNTMPKGLGEDHE